MKRRLSVIVLALLIAGCGHSPEVKQAMTDLGTVQSHIADVETLRAALWQKLDYSATNVSSAGADLGPIEEKTATANKEVSRQFLVVSQTIQAQVKTMPTDVRLFMVAYYKFLQDEQEYLKFVDERQSSFHQILNGETPPYGPDLHGQDGYMKKKAADLAASVPGLQDQAKDLAR